MSVLTKKLKKIYYEEQEKERNIKYDILRVIFMLMVLAVHVVTRVATFSKEYNTTWYVKTILEDFS